MKPIQALLLPVFLSLILLQGCGFHLRGAVTLPDEMMATWIKADDDISDHLIQETKDAIRNSNGDIAKTEAASTATLELVSEDFTRRVATVGNDGKVSEYELNYKLEWRLVVNSTVQEQGTLSERQNYKYSSTEVLGKSQEEKYLRELMEKDVVRDLMRSLRRR